MTPSEKKLVLAYKHLYKVAKLFPEWELHSDVFRAEIEKYREQIFDYEDEYGETIPIFEPGDRVKVTGIWTEYENQTGTITSLPYQQECDPQFAMEVVRVVFDTKESEIDGIEVACDRLTKIPNDLGTETDRISLTTQALLQTLRYKTYPTYHEVLKELEQLQFTREEIAIAIQEESFLGNINIIDGQISLPFNQSGFTSEQELCTATGEAYPNTEQEQQENRLRGIVREIALALLRDMFEKSRTKGFVLAIREAEAILLDRLVKRKNPTYSVRYNPDIENGSFEVCQELANEDGRIRKTRKYTRATYEQTLELIEH